METCRGELYEGWSAIARAPKTDANARSHCRWPRGKKIMDEVTVEGEGEGVAHSDRWRRRRRDTDSLEPEGIYVKGRVRSSRQRQLQPPDPLDAFGLKKELAKDGDRKARRTGFGDNETGAVGSSRSTTRQKATLAR